MKKTTTINLAQTPFTIDDDAYSLLESYLNAVRSHFADSADKEEIIRDIETRMAEYFLEKELKVVTLSEVQHIIEKLGTVEQFESESESPREHTKSGKRLYRNPQESVIAGVSSGLGYYFGIDPVIIRVLFVASIFLGGFGILLYFILWVATPSADTPSEQLAMRGDPITLSNIADMIKEKAQDKEMGAKVSGFAHDVFGRLGAFIERAILPALRIIIGMIFVLGGLSVALGMTTLLGIVLVGIPWPMVVAPYAALLTGPLFLITVTSVYFTITIPAVAVFVAGLAIVQKKRILIRSASWALFVIWCLAAITAGIAGSKLVSYVAIMEDQRSEERQAEIIFLPEQPKVPEINNEL